MIARLRDDMQLGDHMLFYHSSAKPPAVVGTAKVGKWVRNRQSRNGWHGGGNWLAGHQRAAGQRPSSSGTERPNARCPGAKNDRDIGDAERPDVRSYGDRRNEINSNPG